MGQLFHFVFCYHGCSTCLPAKVKQWYDTVKPLVKLLGKALH